MKIVKIYGGFGNQMFQYAFGRGLEQQLGESVLFDLHWFDTPSRQLAVSQGKIPVRSFELDIFPNLKLSKTSFRQVDRALGGSHNLLSKVKRALNRNLFLKIAVPDERDFQITDENAQYDVDGWPICPPGIYYLCGYWQRETYFKKIEEEIRQTFRFPEIKDDFNQVMSRRIQDNPCAVCMHIRRGDYLNFGWELPTRYYQLSVDYIRSRIKNPTFFVFGQDCEGFVRNELHIEDEEYILIGNENTDNQCNFRDMHLMSLCRHSIIANSSFSWWGAWLANNDDQIVIAPCPWINDQDHNCPPHWTKIHYKK